MMANETNNFILSQEGSLTTLKIKNFRNLPVGWNHGEGRPPSKEVVEQAMGIIVFAENRFLSTDAVPSLDGGIHIAIYKNTEMKESYLEIAIASDGNYNISRFDKQNNSWEITTDKDVSRINEVESEIKKFWRETGICQLTSEFYPKSNFSYPWAASQAQPSKTTRAPYQLFKENASRTPEPQYVSI